MTEEVIEILKICVIGITSYIMVFIYTKISIKHQQICKKTFIVMFFTTIILNTVIQSNLIAAIQLLLIIISLLVMADVIGICTNKEDDSP